MVIESSLDLIGELTYEWVETVVAILLIFLILSYPTGYVKIVAYAGLAIAVTGGLAIAAFPLVIAISPLLLPVVIAIVVIIPLVMVFSD